MIFNRLPLTGLLLGAGLLAAAPAIAAPAATAPATTPAPAATPTPPVNPPAAPAVAAATKPAAGSPVFPDKIDPKYASLKPGTARRKTCDDQYKLNKAGNANGGLPWNQKGGGYYSACNKHLKGA